MKVLLIFNHPAPYKVRMFNELAKLVDLTVIFERTKAKNRPEDFYKENQYNFKHIFLYKGYVGNEGVINSEVKEYVKKHHSEFDVIIMNGYSHFSEISTIKYLKKNKIPYVLLINGGIAKTKEFILRKLLKRRYISGANLYLSPSKESNKYLIHYGADEKRIFNYHYGNLSDEDFNIDLNRNEIRQKWNLPLHKKIFVNPSQFIKRKNNLLLIKQFQNKEEVLLLIGDGPEKEIYKKYIDKNNISNVIIMPYKAREDLFEIISSTDCLITLSKEDIFGQTTLEALALGVPVISSNQVMSSLEYINNGFNGYIVDLKDLSQLNNLMNNVTSFDKTIVSESVKLNTYKNTAKDIYLLIKEHFNA